MPSRQDEAKYPASVDIQRPPTMLHWKAWGLQVDISWKAPRKSPSTSHQAEIFPSSPRLSTRQQPDARTSSRSDPL